MINYLPPNTIKIIHFSKSFEIYGQENINIDKKTKMNIFKFREQLNDI